MSGSKMEFIAHYHTAIFSGLIIIFRDEVASHPLTPCLSPGPLGKTQIISVIEVYQGKAYKSTLITGFIGRGNCSLQSLPVTPLISYSRATGPTIKLVKYLGQFLCPQPSGMGRLLDQVRLYSTGCKDHKHQTDSLP